MLMWASWIIQPGQSLTSRPEQNFACRAVANCVEPKRGGLVGLGVGGNWIVSGAVYIASILGVSQSLISLTIVAVGASLPELATSAVAAYKKNAEIAVGNVIGSNIFNIFFILGLSSLIKPLPFHPSGNVDIGAVILASLLLFLWMFTGKRRSLDRWEGIIFLVLYACYITFLVFKG